MKKDCMSNVCNVGFLKVCLITNLCICRDEQNNFFDYTNLAIETLTNFQYKQKIDKTRFLT